MDVVDSIILLIDSISNWFSQFFFQITKFFNGVLNVLSYIWSILESLRYGLTTMLSGLMDLIDDLFGTSIFGVISDGFEYVNDYLGGWATNFLATLLFFAMFRIGFAFVLKIFRMNIDYRTTIDKNERVEKRAKAQHKK